MILNGPSSEREKNYLSHGIIVVNESKRLDCLVVASVFFFFQSNEYLFLLNVSLNSAQRPKRCTFILIVHSVNVCHRGGADQN